MFSLPFCLDLYTPPHTHLLPSYQTDTSLSFRPLLCIRVLAYKTHWQQSKYRLCLFSPTSASPFLWTTGCVFPITQPLSFIPPPNWSLIPAPHLSEGLNKGRGHHSFSSSPPAKLAVVASIDGWKAFTAPCSVESEDRLPAHLWHFCLFNQTLVYPQRVRRKPSL